MINKVHNIDCMELLKDTPDKYYQLAIVDPPYGIGAPKQAATPAQRKKGANRLNQGSGKLKGRVLNQSNCDWDDSIPSQEYFGELLRVGKTIIIFGGNYFTDMLPMSKHWIVWNKIGGHDFQNPFSDAELAWTSIPKKPIKMYTVIQQ